MAFPNWFTSHFPFPFSLTASLLLYCKPEGWAHAISHFNTEYHLQLKVSYTPKVNSVSQCQPYVAKTVPSMHEREVAPDLGNPPNLQKRTHARAHTHTIKWGKSKAGESKTVQWELAAYTKYPGWAIRVKKKTTNSLSCTIRWCPNWKESGERCLLPSLLSTTLLFTYTIKSKWSCIKERPYGSRMREISLCLHSPLKMNRTTTLLFEAIWNLEEQQRDDSLQHLVTGLYVTFKSNLRILAESEICFASACKSH